MTFAEVIVYASILGLLSCAIMILFADDEKEADFE